MTDSSAASSLEDENQWSCTEMKVSKCSYTWTIKNVKYFLDKKVLKSATFHVGGKSESKWYLELHPKGNEDKYNEFCSLFLRLKSSLTSEIEAKYKFSILTPEKHEETKETFQKDGFNIFKPGSSKGFSEFILRDILLTKNKGFVDGDKLSIICEVHVLDEIVDTPAQSDVAVSNCQLSEDLEIFFENENFSDVTLTAGGRKYRVHKAILAARSKVFAGMFTHDMEDNLSNHVYIPDIDGDVCKEMLHFIYTGKVPNLDKLAEGLLEAADKYKLTKLKAMCEEELSRRLNVENAASTLILADLNGANQLKAETVKFISIHTLEVLQTEGWKNMSSAHLPLIMETFLAVEKFKTCQTDSNK